MEYRVGDGCVDVPMAVCEWQLHCGFQVGQHGSSSFSSYPAVMVFKLGWQTKKFKASKNIPPGSKKSEDQEKCYGEKGKMAPYTGIMRVDATECLYSCLCDPLQGSCVLMLQNAGRVAFSYITNFNRMRR